MKKVILLAVIALAGVVSANAQAYVGGSLSFGSTTSKNEVTDTKVTTSSFSIAPEVGYSLTDKLDLGIALLFGTGKDANKTTTSYSAAPYVRYSLVEFGKFSVLGRAALYVRGSSEKEDGVDNKLQSTVFGLNVAPVLSYNLSEHFVLLADLNFLSLNFASTSAKYGDTKMTSGTGFSLGADTDNLLNTGNFTIGFAYKF